MNGILTVRIKLGLCFAIYLAPNIQTIKTPSHTPSILFLSEESYDMVKVH